jgi:hypothetical protein
VNIVDITCDTAYPVAGYALTAASLGVSTIHILQPVLIKATNATNLGLLPVWDQVAGTLKFYKGGSTVTVTSGSGALTTVPVNDTYVDAASVVRCVVYGDAPTG